MYSADTVTSLAFIGAPYNYNDICLIYPLSVGKVLALQEKYGIYLQILTMDRSFMIRTLKEKGVEVNASDIPQPFDYLIQSADYDSNFLLELERAFRTFIKEEVRILSKTRQIVVGSPKEKRIIDINNFSDFQNILRLQNKIKEVEPIPENESERAKYFREKRELRDAVKRKQESANAPSFTDLMSALCAYSIGINSINIKDVSIYALYTQLNVSGSKERYDSEMHFLYGGADPKKLKPKYWITKQ